MYRRFVHHEHTRVNPLLSAAFIASAALSCRGGASVHQTKGEPGLVVFTRNTQHPHTYTTILTYESTLGLPTKPVY